MALILVRTAILFFALLFLLRLMGKRQIGEMQPYELVVTLLIAELACIPMADTSIPLLYGLVSVLTIFLMHQVVCLLDLHAKGFKKILSGKPSVVINKNGIDFTQLKKNNLDLSDLMECLRNAGYFSFDSVDYALYEANGSFSALESKQNESEETSLPLLILENGKYQEENLNLLHLGREYFDDILRQKNIASEKKVLVLTMDGNGKIYLQEKGKAFETFCVSWEGKKW